MARCAFCLREGKLSGEHLWSDWICELFPDIEVKFRKRFVSDANATEWEKSGMGHRVKVVCKHCNENWMSDLESKHAKPALKGMILGDAPVRLNREQLVSIAIFAFKSAVIGDHMQNAKPFFLSLARQKFSRTLAIPSGCQVWIGCIGESDPHHATCGMRYSYTPPGIPNGYHIYTFTWGVGRFVLQLTSTRWKTGRLRRRVIPHLTQNSYWNDAAIPIWSKVQMPAFVQWPPPRHLVGNVLNEFSDRWRRMSGPFFWK
jgi:hypothetical protein